MQEIIGGSWEAGRGVNKQVFIIRRELQNINRWKSTDMQDGTGCKLSGASATAKILLIRVARSCYLISGIGFIC